MRKPKRLLFSYNSLQPVTTYYAPAAWRRGLAWLEVAASIREAHLAFLDVAASIRSPRRYQDIPATAFMSPPGSPVYVYNAEGQRVLIGTTV